ncbi:MAG: filamentous hemagglutinin N-terminal domain-containing protein [Planctomycetes bacterium]|nr:filamentous hemagglutinin N-terminal domain-containing protein [Planctomycetota bacterium]
MRKQLSVGAMKTAAGLADMAEHFRVGSIFGVGRVGGWSAALSGALVAALSSGALAGPDGAKVVRGDVNISRNGAETVIRAGRNSIINYRSFDIGRGETVRFLQPDAQARVLNRITGAAPTRIDGSLIANGRVYIVNPSGVLFSGSARIDVAGLYAAAGKISDSDFVRGSNRFTDMKGQVINEGTITADFVGLLGKSVTNGGTINAPEGTVVMAAGEDVLIGERTGNVFVKVKGAADDSKGAAVTNTGDINAQRGRLSMSAGDVYSMAIRAGGKMNAKTAKIEGQGKGTVKVDGQIDASSATGKGGDVTVTGQNVALEHARIDASGATGGGNVLVGGNFQGKGEERRAETTTISADSAIKADATVQGDGGRVVAWSDKTTSYGGSISAKGGEQGGDGGNVEVSGKVDLIYGGRMELNAPKGTGGTLLLDPKNIEIKTAGGSAVGGATTAFGTTPGASQTITPGSLDNAGFAAVVLQASNNITVTDAISLSTSGVSITMQAGASIILNAGITTNNGAITLIANELSSAGVVNNQRDAGSAVITFASGVTLNAGSANITIRTDTGAGNTQNASGNITLGNITTTGHALIRNIGPTAGSGIVRTENTSLVTATSAAFDVSGAGGGGSVGGAGTPIRLSVTNAEAVAGTGGAFLTAPSGALTVGGATLGGLSGVTATGAGAVDVSSSGLLTVSEGVSSGSGTVTLASTGAGVAVNAAVSAPGGFSSSGTTFTNNSSGTISTSGAALTINHTSDISLSGTLSAGAGNISLTGAAISIDAAPTTTGRLTLTASGAVTQTAAISAGDLLLSGAGTFALTNSSNNVTNLASDATGTTSYTDTNTVVVGTVGAVVGITSGSANVTLQAATITVNDAINTTTGTLSLRADAMGLGAAITADGGITVRPLTAGASIGLGAGAGTLSLDLIELTNLNSTGTVTIGTGNASVITTDALALGGEDYNLNLNAASISTGGITLNAGKTLTLNSSGAVTQSGAIVADNLLLNGVGTFTLTNTSNNVTTLASSATGAVTYIDFDGVDINTIGVTNGISSGGAAVSIEAPVITVTQAIDAGAGVVTLTTDDLTIGNTVTGNGGITLRNASGGTTIGVAGGAGTLSISQAELDFLASTGTVTIGRNDGVLGSGAITSNALALGAESYNLAIVGSAAIDLAGATLNTAKTLSLNAGTGVNITGAIVAPGGFSSAGTTFDNSAGGTITTTNTPLAITHTGVATVAGALASGSGAISVAGSTVNQNAGVTTSSTYTATGGAGGVSITAAVAADGGFTSSGGTFSNSGSGTITTTTGNIGINHSGATATVGAALNSTSGNISVSGSSVAQNAGATTGGTYTATGGAVSIAAAVAADGGFGSTGTTFSSSGAGTITTVNNAITINHTSTATVGAALASGSGAISVTGTTVAQNAGATTTGTYTATATSGGVQVQGAVAANGGFTSSGTTFTSNGAGTITTTTGAIDLNHTGAVNIGGNIDGGTGGITVDGSTVSQTGGATTSSTYAINATGNVTIAGNTTASDGFSSTSTSGTFNNTGTIDTNSADVTITQSDVAIDNTIGAGTGPVLITADTIAVNSVITSGDATVRNLSAGATIGLAGGAGTLNLTNTELSNFAASGTLTIGRSGGNASGALNTGTIVGGTVTSDLHLIGDSIATAGLTLSPNKRLTLEALTGGATQSGNLVVTFLRLMGAGTFNLNDSTNNFGTIAANTNGAVTVNGSGNVTVGSVGDNGITTGGNAVSMDFNGVISVGQAINAAASTVSLTQTDCNYVAAITGNGGITIQNRASGTTIGLGTAPGDLSLDATELGLLSSTGTVTIGRSDANAATSLTTSALNLSATGYDLHLIANSISTAGLTAGAGKRLTLEALTGGVSQSGAIVAANLRLIGAGSFNLSNTGNNVQTLAGNVSGTVNFNDSGSASLTIGTLTDVGLTSDNSAITLTTPSLFVNQALNAGTNTVVLNADSADINAVVTGDTAITVRPNTAGRTINLAGPTGGLDLSNAELGNLSTTGALTIGRSNSGAVTTGAVALGGTNLDLVLQGASISTGGIVINTGRSLTLNAISGGATQSGGITAGDLVLIGVGNFTLNNPTNDVSTITGGITGNLVYFDNTSLAVAGSGIDTNGGAVTLIAGASPTGLTINQPVNAGAGVVTLSADNMAINAGVTGNGGIIINAFTDGTTIGVGGAAGTLDIDNTELANLNSTGLVSIGNSLAAGLTANTLNLSGTNYSLSLGAEVVTVNGITLNTGKSLTLASSAGDVTVNGAILAPGGFSSTAVGGQNVFAAPVVTSASAISVTGPARVAPGGGVFDTTNSGAAPAGADISFSGILTGTTAGVENIALTAGTGGTITVSGAIGGTRLNTLNVVSALAASLADIHAAAGGISLTAGTITLSNGADTTGGGNIALNGAVNATGGTGLDAGVGSIIFGASSSLAINGLTYALTGDEIDLPAVANSVTGSAGSALTLQSTTTTQAIRIGDTADTGAGVLDITDTDLAALASSLGSVTIGRADGSHAINILSSNFRSATVIRTPVAAGTISVDGQITGENSNTSITLTGSGSGTTLAADIVTPGAVIQINDPVTLSASLAGNVAHLDTTNGGAAAAGAGIGITGTVSAATDGGQGLDLRAGTGGVVTLGGTAGPGGARLLSFVIQSASSANLPAVNAGSGGISLTGGTFTLSNGASTTSGGTFTVANSGLLTIDTTALTLDGAFSQTGAGAVSLGSNINTSDDSVSFASTVTLTGPVTIDTGMTGNDVMFSGRVEGAGNALTLNAGTGIVTFSDRVGSLGALGTLTVGSSGAINVAGGTFPTIDASGVAFTSTGLVTLSGAGLGTGGIRSASNITINGGSLNQGGSLTAQNITINTTGAMLVNNSMDVTTAGGVIALHSGTSGTGDLTFGANSPILTADTITLRAGDGTGGAGTTAIVDALTNSPTFNGFVPGAPSPTNFTIRADGTLTTAAHIPDEGQFTDLTGMTYTIQSDDGMVRILSGDGHKVNGTLLTLTGQTGVEILDTLSVQSLTVNGSLTLGADLISNGDICLFNPTTLSAAVTISSGTGTLFIKNSLNSGAFALTLRGAEIEIESGGSVSGTGTLAVEPNADAKNITLGGSDTLGGAELVLSDAELLRIADGFSAVTFGRSGGAGAMTINTTTPFNDPTTFAMGGAGGTVAVNGALSGAGNGAFAFNTPAATIAAAVTTAGGAVTFSNAATINGDITTGGGLITVGDTASLGAVTISTGGGIFTITGATTLTGDAIVSTAGGNATFTGDVNGDSAGTRALTVNAGAGNATFAAVGSGQSLASLTTTAALTTVNTVLTSGLQSYTGSVQTGGNLASSTSGAITITGNLGITADTAITTAGGGMDTISIGGTADTVTGFGEKALTLNAGAASVTITGNSGSTNGFSTFAATGSTISTGSVRTTTGAQTFTGAATVTGDILSGSDVTFTSTSGITGNVNGAILTFTGNSTVGGNAIGTGDVTFGGTSGVTGNVSGAVLTFTGDSTVGGNVTGTGNVTFSAASTVSGNVSGNALVFTGPASLGGNVTSTTTQTYSSTALLGAGAGGPVSVSGTVLAFNGGVTLGRSVTVDGTTSANFASTILSEASEFNSLTVNSPNTTFGAAIGGNSGDNQELGSLSTDAAGVTILAAPTVRTRDSMSFGDAVTLGSDVIATSTTGGVAFLSLIDSDSTTARALTVNSTGNTVFTGNIGGTNRLSTITTDVGGTTFLPSTVRTNGQQTYLDDVRLVADTTLTVETSGGVTLGARTDSDTATPRSLTVNTSAAGDTRFGGAVGSQNLLASLTTNADGALFLGGGVTTNGAQSYGESAATLTGDAVLTGNGITFAGTVDSDMTPRALTLVGGSGGVTLTGAAGVASNLASLTASGTAVNTRAVTTVGDQTYSGNLTMNGNSTGSAFTSNGAAVITGNVTGTNILFRALTTLSGNVSSFQSGGTITFENALLLGANSVMSGTAGPVAITFSNTVDSLDATARSLTINSTGATTFSGIVGGGRRLSALTTDAGGSTAFNGGNLLTSGAANFGDAVTLGADTTIGADSVRFGSTLDSATSTPRNLTITSASTTEFLGNTGSVNRLGRLLVNDQAAASTTRSTSIGGNITLSNGMVLGDQVVLVGDSTINGGSGTLFFRSTIDADSQLNNRNLTLLSSAVATVSSNTTSTDIVPVGSDRTVVPFRFGGSIGAKSGQRLGGLTIGGDLSSVPLSATAVFANFNQAGYITKALNPNAFSLAPSGASVAPTFSINVGSGGFTMGQSNKVVAFGNLTINATGGTARVGDLVATANLSVNASQIRIRTRPGAPLFDDQFVPEGSGVKLDNDAGVDFVSNGRLQFTGPITREGSAAAFFANSNGAIDVVQGAGLIFAQFDGGVAVNLFDHDTTNLLPVDLKTARSNTNVATSIAGAIPRDRREREVTSAVVLSSAFGKLLEAMELYVKDIDPDSLASFLIGRSLYQDVPLTVSPTGKDYKVSLNRLSSKPVLAAISAFCDLAYADGQKEYNRMLDNEEGGERQTMRLDDIKTAVANSWDAYVASGNGGETGPGFRVWLTNRGSEATDDDKLSLEALDKARVLFDRIDEIGLSPRERDRVRSTIKGYIGPGIDDIEGAIVGSSVASIAK